MSRTVLRVKLFQIGLQLGLCLCAGLAVGTAVAIAISLAVAGVLAAVVGVVLARRVVWHGATEPIPADQDAVVELQEPLEENGIFWPTVDVLEAEMRGHRSDG